MAIVLTFERLLGDGRGVATEEVLQAEWSDVEQAIRAMDGRLLTSVVLTRDDWSSLSVGGGGSAFNVVLTTANEEFFSLLTTDPTDAGDGDIELVVGGQLGAYPSRRVVKLEQALSVARGFVDERDPFADHAWDPEARRAG